MFVLLVLMVREEIYMLLNVKNLYLCILRERY